ncbi:DUF2852 domain-containing protein [Aureimonas fodinaquatilis]|uniref:DUF2852 domain-containing protein n=1 Tax=Aureimonas fodinaquatilis TaxID=2565783 RepID=A0A5B0DSF5_9HYPH|nr:DUF2852 domain-containing protein [Aureimonas fodinaquatilis]KAA0968500.1 DUF2852 domain-containing protein [Aureimonas fodinaquatilis]
MTSQALIRPAWTPATIALMVLGFIVYWPLGLAVLAYILWGDRLEAFRSDVSRSTDRVMCGFRRSKANVPFAASRTGNVAFDDWRDQELARLDAERQRLDDARNEFETYARELRRAKDKEEFDRFMRDRNKNDGNVVDVS